jgi:hypothetical protein
VPAVVAQHPAGPRRKPNDLRQIGTKTEVAGRFTWDKDPELEFVTAAIRESGKTPEWIERETEKMGNKVSRYAILGWLHGGTKRPQNYTMTMVMRAIGWTKIWSDGADRNVNPYMLPK